VTPIYAKEERPIYNSRKKRKKNQQNWQKEKEKEKETGFQSFQKGACQGFGALKNTTCTQGKAEIF
jgi:hypothetical protein